MSSQQFCVGSAFTFPTLNENSMLFDKPDKLEAYPTLKQLSVCDVCALLLMFCVRGIATQNGTAACFRAAMAL